MNAKWLGRWLVWALALCASLSMTSVASAAASADKIIISGASGQLGELVVKELLARKVDPKNLILVSRTPEKLAEYAKMGAVTRYGDVDHPESLPAAYAGGTRMLMISLGGAGSRAPRHKLAFDAAAKAGVRHIVYTSSHGADVGGSRIADEHKQSEEYLRATGVRWTMLRNAFYADAQVRQAIQMVKDGRAVVTPNDTKSAPVAREDCAAAAAGALLDPRTENQVYEITGPELFDKRDLARIAAEISGVKIEIVEQAAGAAPPPGAGGPPPGAGGPPPGAGGPPPGAGGPPPGAGTGVPMMPTSKPVVSQAVQQLSGRPGMTIRQILEAHRDELVAAAAARKS
jgi:NAD(P)H dehydrogenase (quinone)